MANKMKAARTPGAENEMIPDLNVGHFGPTRAFNTPSEYRVRVRMYRHGLGDCFLITFPRKGKPPFHMMIDCGALARDKTEMTMMVEHIRDTTKDGQPDNRARLDVVIATHEHRDHVSGFNQARPVFNNDIDVGSVWMSWAENLTQSDARELKEAKKLATKKLNLVLASAHAHATQVRGLTDLLRFTSDDDSGESATVAHAMAYLKQRGKDSQDLRFLEPGGAPFELEDLTGFRFYVLGPPRDPSYLKTSAVTQKMKEDGIVYHLAKMGTAGLDALGAAVDPNAAEGEICHPFSPEHRIARPLSNIPSPYFVEISQFVTNTYDKPEEAWRRIDNDWLLAFGELALALDNDTNNTSLVIAIECTKTRDVLLFVGDAQLGNWLSWSDLSFQTPGQPNPCTARELLCRTVFYKVGHHCSHNATMKKDGLELMTRDNLVAFIPLDMGTAKLYGWNMPAGPLFKELEKRTNGRVFISDVNEHLSTQKLPANVIAMPGYVDYFLR